MDTHNKSKHPAGAYDGSRTAQDFLSIVQQEVEARLESRIDQIHEKIDAIRARSEGREPAAAPSNNVGENELIERIKATMSGVFIDSGLLESLVCRVVDRELESRGDNENGEANDMRKQAGGIVKEFLSQNLDKIFRKEITSVVEDSIAKFLSGDRVKELIDDKFRAVTLYMKTDVIPKEVEKVLAEMTT